MAYAGQMGGVTMPLYLATYRKGGTLHFHWKDEAGQTLKAEKAITLA